MKTKLLLVAVLASAGAILVWVKFAAQSTPTRHERPAALAVAPRNVMVPESRPVIPETNSEPVEAAREPGSLGTAVEKPQPATAKTKPAKARVKPALLDPDAREALALVGADPYAEQYWVSAINDPGLPANERKDLIEDLNEDGLSDPKHPGPEDLPLIVSRLELIEQLAPYSMDEANMAAFAEAYKDLVNLLNGVPVR